MPQGRTTTYSDKIAAAICERLSKGEPLAHICADEGFPAVRTVSDWKKTNETFSADFAHAREEGFDAIALDALAIADDTHNDTKLVGGDEEGGSREVANTEWISRSKLRVETRLKLLAKWDPKRYGDATMIKHADADGEKIKPDDISTMTRLASMAQQLANRLDVSPEDPE